MTGLDLLQSALGNLWRMKLRSSLTMAGIVIAIGAFVTMLSFGAGNRELVSAQFQDLGLLTTMQVYPPHDDSSGVVLDDAAVLALGTIPGVQLAYPFDDFTVSATTTDTVVTTSAQALPGAALDTRLFGHLLAGTPFTNDDDGQALVTDEFLDMLGIEDPETIIGREFVISVEAASADSAIARAMSGALERVETRLLDPSLDGLSNRDYVQALGRLARDELATTTARFVDAYMHATETVSDTVVVCGVLESRHGRRLRVQPIVLPVTTARRLSAGLAISDPMKLMSALQDGSLFGANPGDARSYPRVTLDLEASASHRAVGDSVTARGFRTFSFAREFDEIRKFFIFFNLGLSAIGLVALVTAALGIANTMMMSITERQREIGIWRSLGADEFIVRMLFLVESATIGGLGATAGVALGWVMSRIGSAIARLIMERQDMDPVELFTTPWWLVLLALAVGVAVSLVAGLYPAARAARIDPVEALRQN